jgi:hypothetical protein
MLKAHTKAIKAAEVQYKLINKFKHFHRSMDKLPFIKRNAYRDEREFRFIFLDLNEKMRTKEFPIDLDCIQRVTLSPWMPKNLKSAVKSTINSICEEIDVVQSSLIKNQKWILHGRTFAMHRR